MPIWTLFQLAGAAGEGNDVGGVLPTETHTAIKDHNQVPYAYREAVYAEEKCLLPRN